LRRRKKCSPFRKFLWLALALCLLPFFLFDGAFICEHRPIPFSEPENPQGIGVYVINMECSADRRASILQQVEQLGFPWERMAVDGSLLSEEEIDRVVDKGIFRMIETRFIKKGELGCFLSHAQVWKAFLQSSYQYAIVFEDDVQFDVNKLREIVSELTQTPAGWDVVSFDTDNRQGMPLTLRRLKTGDRLVAYLGMTFHMGAYLISRKAAAALLSHAFPIKMASDNFYSRGWEFGLKFAGVEPIFAFQVFSHSVSETMEPRHRDRSDPLNQMRFWVMKRVFEVKSRVMRFVYNLKLYFQLREA
jgi:glycosyl transferase family 25